MGQQFLLYSNGDRNTSIFAPFTFYFYFTIEMPTTTPPPPQGCDGSMNFITSMEGYITSPNFDGIDSNYPDNYICRWHLTSTPGMVFSFSFDTFLLEGGSSNCSFDALSFFESQMENDGSMTSRLIGVFCGALIPQDFRANKNNVIITFQSDERVGQIGFNLTFKQIPTPSK